MVVEGFVRREPEPRQKAGTPALGLLDPGVAALEASLLTDEGKAET